MIVVTGNPRTGTSMMLQTLLMLGFETPARPFSSEHYNIMNYNKKGFYDLCDDLNGVRHDRYCGQVVKLFPGALVNTPKHLISKLIVCTRNRDDAISSYEPIRLALGYKFSASCTHDAGHRLIDSYTADIDHITIEFDKMRKHTEKCIDQIINYLGIRPSTQQIVRAISNVD